MKKVLVVDDSQAIRKIEEKYLQELGFTVLEAINGEEALEILKKIQI